ncbi:hypothetical protein CL645_02415 [bacterium]|nr:hypothetical protein [bacterium]
MKILKILFCLFVISFSDVDLGDFERGRFEEIYRNSRNSIVGIKVVKSKMSPSVYGDVSQTEIGSGFVYDSEEGLILTTASNVRDAKHVGVLFNDGRSVEAKVVGYDVPTDLAVLELKIKRPHIPSLKLSQNSYSVGESLMVMSPNPEGICCNTSKGIVSATTLSGNKLGGSLSTFFQFDAALNGGQQGGALLSLRGEVIGMPTLKQRNSENLFLNFALPVDIINIILPELIENGRYLHVDWGLDPVAIPEEIRLKTGYLGEGLYVPGLSETGSGWRTGLRTGDVITALDGNPLAVHDDFWSIFGSWIDKDNFSMKGHTVTVYRNGTFLDFDFRVVRRIIEFDERNFF